jgi:hypothetical protein
LPDCVFAFQRQDRIVGLALLETTLWYLHFCKIALWTCAFARLRRCATRTRSKLCDCIFTSYGLRHKLGVARLRVALWDFPDCVVASHGLRSELRGSEFASLRDCALDQHG